MSNPLIFDFKGTQVSLSSVKIGVDGDESHVSLTVFYVRDRKGSPKKESFTTRITKDAFQAGIKQKPDSMEDHTRVAEFVIEVLKNHLEFME